MVRVVNKPSVLDIGSRYGQVDMSLYRSIEYKLATIIAHRVAFSAGKKSEITVDFLVKKLRVAKDELLLFLAERKNINKVRGMVSKRMYGVRVSFEGNSIRVSATGN